MVEVHQIMLLKIGVEILFLDYILANRDRYGLKITKNNNNECSVNC